METETSVVFPSLRCAPFHTALEADPVGSAGSYDAYLCVEVPQPWEHDISANEPFVSLCNAPTAAIVAGDGRRWRPQGLVPMSRPDESVQVIAFVQPGGARTGKTGTAFRRREWLVDRDGLTDLCAAIVGSSASQLAEFDGFSTSDSHDSEVELFVCTHGQRDVCCGGSGTSLFLDLDQRSSVNVRRISHTGGHRFAPTAITFPDGYAWAHLSSELALAVVNRTVEPGEVADHIRGSTLFSGGPPRRPTGSDWSRSAGIGPTPNAASS